MITFSRRYAANYRSFSYRRRLLIRKRAGINQNISQTIEDDDSRIISPELRTRLQSEIQYLIENNFIEECITVDNRKTKKRYLHEKSLKEISQRELGSNLVDTIDCRTLSFDQGSYSDIYFFDLVEILLIFAKQKKRDEMSLRLKRIFDEIDEGYTLYNCLIYMKGETGLRSIIPLIKDAWLKAKLEEVSGPIVENNQMIAKLSADIVLYLFSSTEGKSQTKATAENLIKKTVKRITTPKKEEELKEKINNLVKISKDLSNNITDIRHTEKHTIPIDGLNMYKLIAKINLSIVEMIILSIPEDYIIETKVEEVKDDYLSRYNIDKNSKWYVEDVITYNPDTGDIPF